jgi:transcriptional regulator of acetoin/glycerol metabolism
MTLEECKRQHVLATLAAHGGCIAKAARELDIERSSLQRMLRKWNLR